MVVTKGGHLCAVTLLPHLHPGPAPAAALTASSSASRFPLTTLNRSRYLDMRSLDSRASIRREAAATIKPPETATNSPNDERLSTTAGWQPSAIQNNTSDNAKHRHPDTCAGPHLFPIISRYSLRSVVLKRQSFPTYLRGQTPQRSANQQHIHPIYEHSAAFRG